MKAVFPVLFFLIAVPPFASGYECTNMNRYVVARSALYEAVDSAAEEANFGSPYLRRSTAIRDLKVRRLCVLKSERIELLTVVFQVRAKAAAGRFEGYFSCHAQAQRHVSGSGRAGRWEVSRPVCRDRQDSGNNGNDGGSSGGPDDVDDGSGTGRGSGGGPDDVDDGSGSRGGGWNEGSGSPGDSGSDV